ncbi:MAG: DNA gyrase subunit A [Clostridiales bacterium]|nr:DNA gyrase subunit A [Clostridiales bacterium]
MDENKQMNIGRIQNVNIEKEMKESFISYAMAVIVSRALPDVRDGLKPVHRRILYSMSELGLWADRPYRKCARIVGDVLGKYHPHGDSAVYDALVRLAQDFNMSVPLVDGHGNFGSIDGDSAAAMRYTEARMSKIAAELLSDIDKETVDFTPNFDETLTQPTVLPCRIPNLLVNGSGGIAVGMATNIPPHNLSEVIDGAVALIDNPELDSVGLMDYIKGPDFPTGGVIMGYSGIRSAYATGRGRIVVRAVAEIEEFGHNRHRIVVSEIPYQVNKARLVEKIAEMVHEKRLEGISDLRDESDRQGMRIVIELKRDVNPNVVLNNLYKHTQMQETFGAIMLALVDGEPKILSLHQMLHYYIEHRKDVVVRRTRYELGRAQARAHILEGLLIALDHIDEVIRTIRQSRDDAEAKASLCEKFGLSEKQAQAILDMRLRRLTGLERDKIEAEYAELLKTIEYLTRVLSDMALVMGIIKEELLEVKEKYGHPRRTRIEMVEGEVDIEDLIQKEDMVVTLTRFGYIKRVGADTYRLQNRGGKGVMGLTTREEDFVEKVFVANTHTPILFFTNTGRVFVLKCYQLPLGGRTAKGSAIVNLLRLNANEKITAVLPVEEKGKYLVMGTRKGIIKKTPVEELKNIRQSGLVAIGIREDDELCGVFHTDGNDDIILGTKQGMSIRFHEEDVRPMGRTAMGVRSVKLKDGDEVVDINKVDKAYVLTLSEKGYGKLTRAEEYGVQNRGGMGIRTLNITDKTGSVAGLKLVDGEEDLVLIDEGGTIIRIPASQVSILSRLTQGVRLMRVGAGNRVAALAVVPKAEETEE